MERDMKNNNEIMGFSGITRKVLKSSLQRGKILLHQEKESNNDSDGGNADNRRCSQNSSDIGIHCQGTMQEWRYKVQKSRQELSSQTGGLESLHRQSPGTRQKIK